MKIGIYKIINKLNGKFYIGSSKNIKERWKEHLEQLRNNRHHNIIMQRAWNKGERFYYEIIEECSIDNLLIKEQLYLDQLKPFNLAKIYNIGSDASGGDNLTNHPEKERIIKQRTKTLRDNIKNLSKEERKKRSQRMSGKNNPNYGQRWNMEQRRKMSKRMKGIKPPITGQSMEEYFGTERTEEIKEKTRQTIKENGGRTGKNNSFFEQHHTEEYKQKARERQLGVYRGNQNIPFSVDGIVYQSLGEASKKLEIPPVTIWWRIKSNNPKFKEYKYRGEND